MSRQPRTSPTSIEADWRCQRERFYLTEYQGVGLEPTTLNEDLEIGKRMHVALEAFFQCLAKTPDVSHATSEALEAVRAPALCLTDPWQTWLEQMVYAWGRRVWGADLAARYRVLLVEEMLEFEHERVRFRCKPDLVLEELATKLIWIYDFKTARHWDQRKWLRAIQLQLGARAVHARLGQAAAGTIIQGLDKGTMRDGRLYHALVYGYRKEAAPGITKAAYSHSYRRGFERFDVTGYERGARGWVDDAPDAIIADCFPRTQPIHLDQRLLSNFLAQRASRERVIAAAEAADLALVFPQTFSACESDRHRCPYFDICHNPTVAKDPAGSGLYTLRPRVQEVSV